MGAADAALGEFPQLNVPLAVIELKGATTDLDRDRSNGRTAVQQCWDYLNALPGCPWGIVSNFRTIRLYHREKGSLCYEEFDLQELRDRDRFDRVLLHLRARRAAAFADRPSSRGRWSCCTRRPIARKASATNLYKEYQWRRLELIEHLNRKEGKSLDEAIRIAQKLLDRIIFIAFCEDRELLPEKLLEATRTDVRMYSRAKNPAWENFLDLFAAVDKGAKGKREITAFNGGLFADDPAINDLELAEEKWTNAFAGFGNYDFSEEVNVEVLGHLFERSITELEKLRVGGLFALMAGGEDAQAANGIIPLAGRRKKTAKARPAGGESPLSKMPKSAQRKRFGIYYTPPAFTGLIVERTIDALVLRALCRAATAVPGRSRGPHGPGPPEAACLSDGLPGSAQVTDRLRSGLRFGGIPDPRLRGPGRPLQGGRSRPGRRGHAGRGGRHAGRCHSRPDPQPQPVRRGPFRTGRRDHATRPLDPFRPQGQHAGRSVAEHRLGQQPRRR